MTESTIHADAKADLYWSLLQEDDYAEIEKGIGRTRTDVLTETNNGLLAIEIQHTRIPLRSILRRMREHTAIGAHTLWMVTPEALRNGTKFRNLNWIRFIQELQGGIFFLPTETDRIIPARIDRELEFRRDKIVVSKKKYLDVCAAITLDELKLVRDAYFGVNCVSYPEWWIERDYKLLS